jgi:hypothetical protein
MYILFFVFSFFDDETSPWGVLISFVISCVILSIWFGYLFKYMTNGKILEEKGMIERYKAPEGMDDNRRNGQQHRG